MTDRFGLKEEVIKQIQGVLRRHPEVEAAVLYGSRAKGNYREGSDIDLSLSGDISFASLGDIIDELDDLLLAYTIDVAVYDHLNNGSLKDHIRRVGKVFWEPSNAAALESAASIQ
jgi:predicted nucleotidyltransferase